MAYNRKNKLKLIIDIQNIYKQHSKHHKGGCSDRYIFKNMIEPVYHISERTFYEYLTEPAPKTRLKDIVDAEKKQLSLF